LNAFPLEETLPAFFEIQPVLASIARTGESLDWYLTTWSETLFRQADEHLIQLVTFYGGDFSRGRTLSMAFWADCPVQAEELRRWLLHPETLQRVGRNAHLLRKDGFEHLFPPAIDVLLSEAAASVTGKVEST
jgi:hypothetical protein